MVSWLTEPGKGGRAMSQGIARRKPSEEGRACRIGADAGTQSLQMARLPPFERASTHRSRDSRGGPILATRGALGGRAPYGQARRQLRARELRAQLCNSR